ncbi:hypothetical protein B0H67DRAFT_118108 [Lasiosphaeris hirsuta]|uniref:Uncharacterized protein n=1 Tax=Lasiosphaeris hirsuta TaxID=260670 RepID=A0AA40AZJ3_9PEZI|nr:hypothetical protein B0H67DRAFT_118108 [Lasiosphaeris hirsuta]
MKFRKWYGAGNSRTVVEHWQKLLGLVQAGVLNSHTLICVSDTVPLCPSYVYAHNINSMPFRKYAQESQADSNCLQRPCRQLGNRGDGYLSRTESHTSVSECLAMGDRLIVSSSAATHSYPTASAATCRVPIYTTLSRRCASSTENESRWARQTGDRLPLHQSVPEHRAKEERKTWVAWSTACRRGCGPVGCFVWSVWAARPLILRRGMERQRTKELHAARPVMRLDLAM